MSKVKEHFKKNKTSYIVGGVCLIVGAGSASALFIRKGDVNIAVSDTMKLVDISYKSPRITEIIFERPGNKAHVIQCIETQEVWPSIRQAAKSLGVTPFDLSDHIRGLRDSVAGLTFRKIAEV